MNIVMERIQIFLCRLENAWRYNEKSGSMTAKVKLLITGKECKWGVQEKRDIRRKGKYRSI